MPDVKFMPHQAEAIGKLRSGSILCGGVGTGKSITALGYFYLEECAAVQWTDGTVRGPMTRPKPLYIITTARKRDTKEWEAEIERFGDIGDIPIVIDSWNNLHKYEDVSNAFFIFDEQRVVGSGAWVKSFLKIAKFNHWILLSATPGDTWSDYIPVFLANGFYKNRTQFLRRHAVFNRFSKYPKIDRWLETGELERLRRRITVVMPFEKKTEPHWRDIYVEYDEALYDRICKDRWDPWKDEPIQDISGACYLMRRAASSKTVPVQVNHKTFEVNVKADVIFWTMVNEHPRVIVFYNYDYELEALKDCFDRMRLLNVGDKNGYSVAEWNGHRHDSIPETKYWVYLVQYSAGAEGWNCVTTNTVIFYSQNYSYKLMSQAAGRIDRLNTPYAHLFYYVLKTKTPIDAAVSKALKGKRNFNEKLFLDW